MAQLSTPCVPNWKAVNKEMLIILPAQNLSDACAGYLNSLDGICHTELVSHRHALESKTAIEKQRAAAVAENSLNCSG